VWKEGQRTLTEFDEYDGYEWKLIHGDVFRPPPLSNDLCLRVGWGTQLVIALVLVLVFGVDDWDLLSLSPIIDSFVRASIWASPFAGFLSGRFFKAIGDGNWRSFLLKQGQFPAFAFALFSAIYAIAYRGPESAVTFPIRWIIAYLILDLALAVAGALVGLKMPRLSFAQNVNQLPRQIPPTSYARSTLLPHIIAAVFVYAAAAAMVHVLMVAAWTNDPLVTDTSSLLANVMAVIVESILCGVVLTFWKLSNEDYRWWWPAFRAAAGGAAVFFIYGIFFWRALWVPFDFVAAFVYLAMLGGLAVLFALIVGSMSFIGSFAFVQLIYNSLKME
jgi:transmembrane 9 superfamily protein 2/4